MIAEPSAAETIGIDIGGTKMLGVAMGPSGEVVREVRVPSPVSQGAVDRHAGHEDLMERIVGLSEQLSSVDVSARREAEGNRSVGIGVPGMVDGSGVIRSSPNLVVANGLGITSQLEARMPGWQVTVDNDATFAALGEWWGGAGRGSSDMVMVTLGTGIGGGLVCGGKLLRGANGFAGEIGHMVVDPSGPVCPCGRKGCWERYASGGGLGRLAREAAHAGQLQEVLGMANGDPEAVRGEHVTLAAAEGDVEARVVLEQLGHWLALGLANITAIVDTEVFVLGGGLVNAIAIVLDNVREVFNDMTCARDGRPEVRITMASLGERSGAVGAAIAARDGLELTGDS